MLVGYTFPNTYYLQFLLTVFLIDKTYFKTNHNVNINTYIKTDEYLSKLVVGMNIYRHFYDHPILQLDIMPTKTQRICMAIYTE